MTDNVQEGSAWQSEASSIAAEEGSGFDYYGLVQYGWGFKFFVKDVDNHDTFYPYDRQDKSGKSKDEALAKAKRDVVKYGLTPKKIETHFVMWMEVDQIFGRDLSNRKSTSLWWAEKVWSPAMKEIIIPKMEKLGINPYGKQVWAHLCQVDDPSGYKTTSFDAEGHEVKRTKQCAYIAEVYPTEAACRAAAEAATGEASTPDGATLDDEIKQVHTEDPEMTLFEIGQIYSLDCKTVADILKYGIDDVTADLKALKNREGVPTPAEAAKYYGKAETVVKRMWA